MKDYKEFALITILGALVVFHVGVVVGNCIAFFTLPLIAPWYIALPLCSFIGLLSTSNELKCPLTKLENVLRKELGLKQIGGFIGHYFLKGGKKCYHWLCQLF